MADLVIKGMALPKMICGEPGYVDVRIFSDGIVIMAKPAPPYYRKFETVPLPEGHGRLGDLDRLFEVIGQDADRWIVDEVSMIETDDVLDAIQNAPTIVPAEGGTDDG